MYIMLNNIDGKDIATSPSAQSIMLYTYHLFTVSRFNILAEYI